MSQASRLPSLFRSATTTRAALRKHIWIWPLVAALGLGAIGWWVRGAVEGAAKDNLSADLRTILDADVEALRIWFRSQEDAAEAVAHDGKVRALVARLAAAASAEGFTPQALRDAAEQGALREEIAPHLSAHEFLGFAVTDTQGRLLAADHVDLIGRDDLDLARELLDALRGGKATVTRPQKSLVALRRGDGVLTAGVPTMFAVAPVRDGRGEVIAGLGLRIAPEKDFTRILSVASAGESGETYAFDKGGLLLSQSRFDDELKQIGLLADRAEEHSILNLELRDPQVDMTRGERPSLRRSQQPLTRMAAAAVAGQPGVDVDGYRDYRGKEVIGAWTWLDDYGMGVATEVDVEEAYRPLYILRAIFWSLFGLLVLSAVAILAFLIVVARLQRSARRAALEAKRLGQYQLEEKLGAGGMGVVYKARHALLRRPTAVKLLDAGRTTEESVARFEREVQLTSQLNHPNTIQIYDYGRTPEGIFYYAMEYLDGINLDDLVRRFGPQPEGRVIHILLQVLGSLSEAHDIGLIHRDIKPANVLLNRRGGVDDVAKVLDFGLVKALDDRHGVTRTSAGSLTGTPQYLSPEGVDRPDTVDARSDLYAVASVGYFLLTGTPVFRGTTVMEVCRQQVREPPQPPSERLGVALAADLEGVILRCLAKAREERPVSARELSGLLARCRSAGSWTPAEARAWWDRHMPRPAGAPAPGAVTPPSTVPPKDPGLAETLLHPPGGPGGRKDEGSKG